MHLIDNNVNKTLTPKIIFDDVSPTIKAFTKLCTISISSHLNTNKHAITDNINMIFEYIINVIF